MSAYLSRPIYGLLSRAGDCLCEPDVAPTAALLKLKQILQSLRTAIQRFYDPAMALAPIVANMRMTGNLPTPVFMRIVWVNENPGVVFDKTNPVHLDGLKFIYNVRNRDWRMDPMFQALGMS